MAKIELDTKRPTYTSDFVPSDIEQAVFLGNPVLDNIMTCMVSLSSEVWAARRRTYVLEAVLEKQGITKELIESYMPTAEEEVVWKKDRDRFIEMTFSPMMRDGTLPISADFQNKKS